MNEISDIYSRYSYYLTNVYGGKTYKLPLNIPVSCPNRVCGMGGCTYCDEKGAGFENLSDTFSVGEQIKKNRDYIGKRYKAKNFIAYFQNFTNTYLPIDMFEKYMNEAAEEDIVEIAVSTRPDCIRKEYLDVLYKIKQEKNIEITIELGLQSINSKTLRKINRGHTLAEYIDAVNEIKKYGFKICTHIILNLPWDDDEDAVETAKILSALKTDFVKLHALYIVDGTVMGEQYKNKEFEICSCEEYKKRVIMFLRYLSKDIWVQRLIGRAPEENSLFANWGRSWWAIRDEIEEEMHEKNYYQGELCDYLDGKSVRKFFEC